jgi:hypothetical protein
MQLLFQCDIFNVHNTKHPIGCDTLMKENNGAGHRVGRVLSVSPVVGIGTPPPLEPQASVPPHPLVRGGGHTRLRLKGWGSPNSNEGTYTVVLYIYKHFVGLVLRVLN